MADFVALEDRPMLRKLVGDAMAGPPPRSPGCSMRLRHSTHPVTEDDVSFEEPFCAVDVKICFDGEFLYCVMLDCTESARCASSAQAESYECGSLPLSSAAGWSRACVSI